MAREALRVLGRTYGEIDDSVGLMAGVASGLAEAHLEACRTARPDPARWRLARPALPRPGGGPQNLQGQWRALAGLIRDRQPADALTVYLRSIEPPLRGQTGDRTYERLADLLLSARACHRALGTEDDFATYVAALRAGQRRKRRLMAFSTGTDSERRRGIHGIHLLPAHFVQVRAVSADHDGALSVSSPGACRTHADR
ncbi:hypothetical protein [Streptomyces sp. NBC_01294]|uniref:hypothetical protein n=1 Tax=Streptomyces sp. NBC_01294 TaxID=2903815 RepID=UPI002DDABF31|nr:hypothetical protein [Streptomyces sp. NBC_01294]